MMGRALSRRTFRFTVSLTALAPHQRFRRWFKYLHVRGRDHSRQKRGRDHFSLGGYPIDESSDRWRRPGCRLAGILDDDRSGVDEERSRSGGDGKQLGKALARHDSGRHLPRHDHCYSRWPNRRRHGKAVEEAVRVVVTLKVLAVRALRSPPAASPC